MRHGPFQAVAVLFGCSIGGLKLRHLAARWNEYRTKLTWSATMLFLAVWLVVVAYTDTVLELAAQLPLCGRPIHLFCRDLRHVLCLVSTYVFWGEYESCPVRNFSVLSNNGGGYSYCHHRIPYEMPVGITLTWLSSCFD